MGQPHKWQKEIIAWANGETIQYRFLGEDWHDSTCPPAWEDKGEFEYRVKPEVLYPKTKLASSELSEIYFKRIRGGAVAADGLRDVANAAIRRAVMVGQVKLP